ncbi:MAG: ATP-binding cassette domain-containing protein, partial [Deltaproteobacteria bacterium]|nr:ATP-binding cassette domain-containing protein [Deltaproteobacteria bacterium]
MVLEEEEITKLPTHKIVYKGIARSFQIINIFPSMTVFENIRNAIASKMGIRFRITFLLKSNKNVIKATEEILDLMELGDRRDIPVSELSYGEQREIEIALTLGLNPKLIMLDEPTAGLNKMETARVIDLIRRVTEDKTLIIVEHDMNVVFN